MSASGVPRNVRKIAVLRANALGDFVFATPALNALKRSWPDAELVYLGREWHQDFLVGRPGPVDSVIVVPKYHGVPHEADRVENPAQVEEFFARMQGERFDIALQMHGGGGNSNPFVRRLGARLSAGFRAAGAAPLDINIPYVLYHNEVLRYLELAESVGAHAGSVQPRVQVTANDRDELRAALPGLREPYAVLHPGASDVRRRWPAAKMAALADTLSARGLRVLITGTRTEGELVESVVRRARAAENVCGHLSLPALTALLDGAALVVSNDTGPLHLARAVGTPTIGIYWVGNVINAGPVALRNHRYAMSWTVNCPACGMDCVHNDAHVPRDGCRHEESFVDEVSVEEVAAHADALLAAVPVRHSAAS